MRFILVVPRAQLFPGLSPQGFLPPGAVSLEAVLPHVFFAERAAMERNSHFKQIIPYMVLTRTRDGARRVLAYQRRAAHTERRLGGLWSIGFGGHVEPLDRDDARVAAHGLVTAAALRELAEETGIEAQPTRLTPAGFINSEREDVSSVHFGVVFAVDLDAAPGDDAAIATTVAAQAEPEQVRWIEASRLPGLLGPRGGPDEGTFEDWSRIAIEGMFARAAARA